MATLGIVKFTFFLKTKSIKLKKSRAKLHLFSLQKKVQSYDQK